MNPKEEYLKFLIMLTIRYNVHLCQIRLKQRQDSNKRYIYDNKYKNTLQFKDNNVRIAQGLFNINILNNLEVLDKLIIDKWQYIIDGLKNSIFNYEWTIVDFKSTQNYKVYKYINSYDLYWESMIDRNYTNPIYFLLNELKWCKKEFYNMFEELIDNGLFNPNRRCVTSSGEPFWCCFNYQNIDEIARKLILDKRTNYQMLSNGSSTVAALANFAMNESAYNDFTFEQKSNCVDLLYRMIKENNCSILEDYYEDNKYYDEKLVESYYETGMPLIFLLFKNEIEISRFDKMINLYRYCISEEGVSRQVDTLKHKTIARDGAIDFYVSLIEKDNPDNTNGVAMLKKYK